MSRGIAARVGAGALSLCAMLTLSACKPPPRDPSQWPVAIEELERAAPVTDPGEAAYRRTCIACHAQDGKGNGATTGADFTLTTGVLTKPDDVLRASIRDGTRGPIGTMPAHGALLSVDEQIAVLAFIRRSFGAGIVVGGAEDGRDAGVGLDAGSRAP